MQSDEEQTDENEEEKEAGREDNGVENEVKSVEEGGDLDEGPEEIEESIGNVDGKRRSTKPDNVITEQPQAEKAIDLQPIASGSACPPGLEYLTALDQLLVKQEVSIMEVVLPFESKNKYSVLNTLGQKTYYATEESNLLCRQLCKSRSPWTIHVLDNFGQPVMFIKRKCNMGAFCPGWPCCCDSVQVTARDDTPLGSVVRKACPPCRPIYSILNDKQYEVLAVRGPLCCFLCLANACCRGQKFSVTDLRGADVGTIQKQFSGLLKEMVTDADNFSVTFPMDLDVRLKATLLAAVFLIDFNYYEDDSGGTKSY